MNLEELAGTIQMDLQGTLARFGGSRALLVRFLKKFPQDTTFETLKEAVAAGDGATVERAAHTLKGVAANLGLELVRAGSDALVTAVRTGRQAEIPALFETLRADYEAAGTAIAALAE